MQIHIQQIKELKKMNIDKKGSRIYQDLPFSKNVGKDHISKILVLIRQFTQEKHQKENLNH